MADTRFSQSVQTNRSAVDFIDTERLPAAVQQIGNMLPNIIRDVLNLCRRNDLNSIIQLHDELFFRIEAQLDEIEVRCSMPMFLGYLLSEFRLRLQSDY